MTGARRPLPPALGPIAGVAAATFGTVAPASVACTNVSTAYPAPSHAVFVCVHPGFPVVVRPARSGLPYEVCTAGAATSAVYIDGREYSARRCFH